MQRETMTKNPMVLDWNQRDQYKSMVFNNSFNMYLQIDIEYRSTERAWD